MASSFLIGLIIVLVGFGVYAWRSAHEVSVTRAGKLLLLAGFFVLPLFVLAGGSTIAIKDSGSRKFCLSCHEMTPYQQSLEIDDSEYIPAVHFQNNLVDRERACYQCHTDYTLYGDLEAKAMGLKHVFVHFFGDVPAPGEAKLYSPYPNKNCLKCHAGGRRFEENTQHRGDKAGLEALYANTKSCLQKGCHDLGHGIKELDDLDRWTRQPSQADDADDVDDLFDDAPSGGAGDEVDDLFDDDEAPKPDTPAAGDEVDDLFDDDEAPKADTPAARDEVDDLFDDDEDKTEEAP